MGRVRMRKGMLLQTLEEEAARKRRMRREREAGKKRTKDDTPPSVGLSTWVPREVVERIVALIPVLYGRGYACYTRGDVVRHALELGLRELEKKG